MKPAQGFSLFELMIGLIILATLLAMALPSFDRLLQTQRADRLRDDLFADLALARAEAMARNQPVGICATENPYVENLDQLLCAQIANAETAWKQGWLVYINLDGGRERNLDDPLLSVYENILGNRVAIRLNIDREVVFDHLGRAYGSNGAFELCGDVGYRAKITITKLGRIHFTQPECS